MKQNLNLLFKRPIKSNFQKIMKNDVLQNKGTRNWGYF